LPFWDEALAYNPDGIGSTIPNLTPAMRERAEQATNLGIPLIAFNVARDLDPASTERADLYIGSGEFISGQSNARRVFAQARADGVTIVRGVCFIQFANGPGFLNARCAGVQSVFDIAGVPLDQIVIGNEDGTEAEISIEAQRIAEYFAANPDTNAVFMLGPAAALGMYFEQAGLEPGEIYATSHDTSPEVFQMIQDGYLLQTIDQQPYMQAFQTIISLYLYHQYGMRPSGFINTSSVVDRSNVDNVVQLVEMGYR
jgi:ABC-type sugar transport system substrate-binding protein